jgi:hypothetical protein
MIAMRIANNLLTLGYQDTSRALLRACGRPARARGPVAIWLDLNSCTSKVRNAARARRNSVARTFRASPTSCVCIVRPLCYPNRTNPTQASVRGLVLHYKPFVCARALACCLHVYTLPTARGMHVFFKATVDSDSTCVPSRLWAILT